MTEYEFWQKYDEYLYEKHLTPDTIFLIEYCNNKGVRSKFPIDNAVKSTAYRGCFEADCLSSHNYDEMIDAPVTTSHRTFSYKNVEGTSLE